MVGLERSQRELRRQCGAKSAKALASASSVADTVLLDFSVLGERVRTVKDLEDAPTAKGLVGRVHAQGHSISGRRSTVALTDEACKVNRH